MRNIFRVFYLIAGTSFITTILFVVLFKDPDYIRFFIAYALFGALAASIICITAFCKYYLKMFTYLSTDVFYFWKNPMMDLYLDNTVSFNFFLFVLCWLGYVFLRAYVY